MASLLTVSIAIGDVAAASWAGRVLWVSSALAAFGVVAALLSGALRQSLVALAGLAISVVAGALSVLMLVGRTAA